MPCATYAARLPFRQRRDGHHRGRCSPVTSTGCTAYRLPRHPVAQVTFRDCYLRDAVKGIYLKLNRGHPELQGREGSVADVTYERIVIDRPCGRPVARTPRLS